MTGSSKQQRYATAMRRYQRLLWLILSCLGGVFSVLFLLSVQSLDDWKPYILLMVGVPVGILLKEAYETHKEARQAADEYHEG